MYLDLSDYAGQYVTIKFLNQSGYGNNMYLDDILIEGILVNTDEISKDASFTIQPNPTTGDFFISIPPVTELSTSLSLGGRSIRGKAVQDQTNRGQGSIKVLTPTGLTIYKKLLPGFSGLTETISLTDHPAGIYFVEIISTNGIKRIEKLIKI